MAVDLGVMLERVRPNLPTYFQNDKIFFGKLEVRKDVVKVSARDYRIPAAIAPGTNYGNVDLDGGTMPDGDSMQFDKATLTPISSAVTLKVTDAQIHQADGDPKSIVDILSKNIAQSMMDMRFHCNAELQTAGDGVKGTVTATNGTTTITLKAAPFYAQLLRRGMTISVYDSTLATKRGEAKITKIDYPNAILTVDAVPGGTTATDKILNGGLSGANPVGFFGERYHVNSAATGTWLGYNRANTPEIRSSEVSAASNALTTPLIRLLLSKVIQRLGVDSVNTESLMFHIHQAQAAAYEELAVLISEIKKGSGNEDFDLLFGNQRWAGVKPLVDTAAGRDRATLLKMDTWGRIESHPLDFLKNNDGRFWHRTVNTTTGTPKFAQLAAIVYFWQSFTDNPAAQGFISNLAVPSGFADM